MTRMSAGATAQATDANPAQNVARWRATLAAALCMFSGMSAIFMGSFPVFLGPVSHDMGWGHATFSQFITIVSITAAIAMPVAGRLIDRIGVRYPVGAGLLLVGGGMALLSEVTQAGALFWVAGMSVGLGSALSGPPAFVSLIASWFDRNRALAMGCILSVAPALGQAVVAPVAQHFIGDLGWRAAYRILAMVTVFAALIGAGFLRKQDDAGVEAPTAVGHSAASTGQALRTPLFWLLALVNCLGSGTILGLTVHLVAWQTGRGVSPESATLVLSALFMAGMVGALISGLVADRTRNIHVLQIFFVLPIAGLILMQASTATLVLLAGGACIGMAMGATTGLAPYLATRYFGLKASAEIFGIILGLTMISLGVSPLLIGIGFDLTGSYTLPLTLAGAAIGISTICVGLLERAAAWRPLVSATAASGSRSGN